LWVEFFWVRGFANSLWIVAFLDLPNKHGTGLARTLCAVTYHSLDGNRLGASQKKRGQQQLLSAPQIDIVRLQAACATFSAMWATASST
jgi:hypothetical protein